MSTAVTVGILAAGLFILVTIAVVLQTMEKNRRERRRLESALNGRARNFQYLLDGFPQGFLGRDLQLLVCQSLSETYEQLLKMDTRNKNYRKQRDAVAERLQQIKAGPDSQQSVRLEDPGKIREVQKLLTSLHKFIAKLQESKRVSPRQAKAYSQQIRELLLQTTIDGLRQEIQEALNQNKHRLALHHMQTVIDKLNRENHNGRYNQQLSEFQRQLEQLQQQAEAVEEETAAKRAEADKEWDKLSQPDDSWKKKAIYD